MRKMVFEKYQRQILNNILHRQLPDGSWDLGMEPFYRLSQTMFGLKILQWNSSILKNSKPIKGAQSWLIDRLKAREFPPFTRINAWAIYLHFNFLFTVDKKLTAQLIHELIKFQNKDGSWGHGSTKHTKRNGSGEAHPFPTALAILALSETSEKVESAKSLESIKKGVSWLQHWIDEQTRSKELASWAIAMLAIYSCETHQNIPEFNLIQSRKIAYETSKLKVIPLEIIPNAARNLDAPYWLMTKAWLLISLVKLSEISTFSEQLKLVRALIALINDKGEVFSDETNLTPYIYCSFNVYFALKTFMDKYSSSYLLDYLILSGEKSKDILTDIKRDRDSIFIASTTEGIDIARKIQLNFEFDKFDTIIWDQFVDQPSKIVIESIEGASKKFNYAIIVCTQDDIKFIRVSKKLSVRDNIIFELGLFIGTIGRDHVFIVKPRIEFDLPSDLLGVIPVSYDIERFKENPQAALGGVCDKIRSIINKTS